MATTERNATHHTRPAGARHARLCVLLGLALGATGCDDKANAPETGEIGEVAPGGALPQVGDPGVGEVRPGRPGEEPAARPPAATRSATSLAAAIARFHTAREVEDRAVQQAFRDALAAAVARPSPFSTGIQARYAALGGELLFARRGALTPAADKLVEVLLDAGAHALPLERLDVAGLEAELKAFAALRVDLEKAQAIDVPEDAALWRFANAQAGQPEAAIAAAALGAGLDDASLPRADGLRARMIANATAQKAYNAALIALDRGLAERLYRFAHEMRFSRRAHPFRADTSDEAGLTRAFPALDALVASFVTDGGVDVDGLVKAVTPAHPDYARTLAAYARYRLLAEQYPTHLELDKDVERLRRGKSGLAVRKLAERLKQEGYYEGELDEKFGPALETAVIAYQQTHQLKDGGEVDRIMRSSLNKTFAERADQLALSLQRLRESDLHQGEWRFGDHRVRGRVNIPAFEATFFIDGVEQKRHRVVVGNNQTETDAKTGKRGKLNQTRLFSAEMATIVLNPTWNVPRRIKEQELDLLLIEEPDYYAKNNFEVKVLSDGTELVVQQPGPGNALGLVKFLFPNEYAIYMHDTPSKKLFGRPVRAFSHGCMRTENPLDLARWILVEVTGRLTDEKFDEILASRKETALALNPKIPMSTDYITTGFDAEGRVIFYADVYGFDKDYLDGKTPYRADRDHPNTLIF